MASKIPIPSNLPQQAAATTPEQPWPLRLLSAKIAEYVSAMSRLWVEGEVITLQRRPNAKVQFFTLADLEEKVSITVKIWSHALPAGIEQGSRVVVCAKPDFYTVNGSLSLFADEVRAVGIGDILARIEALKGKLAAEGLFDPARKQPLPFLPRKVGLICGRNTKAMHDVVVNAQARWAEVEFEIREVQVQGNGAVSAMLGALEELEAIDAVDVIVFARGGGSVEDLLPFSDEQLVRAAAAARTPIVSAIGHETDNPILDLVADYRASTPTDAARRIVPDVVEERTNLATTRRRGRIAIDSLIHRATEEIEALRTRPALAQPNLLVDSRAEDVANLRSWSRTYAERIVAAASADLAENLGRLRTLSPRSTLERGYSVLRTPDGKVVQSVSGVETGDSLSATLADGSLAVTVTEVHS